MHERNDELLYAIAPESKGNVKVQVKDLIKRLWVKFDPNDKETWPPTVGVVSVLVLVATATHPLFVGNIIDGIWYANTGDLIPLEVTHWMPLPELPHEAN